VIARRASEKEKVSWVEAFANHYEEWPARITVDGA
jgi:hypothetical protein